MPYRLVAFARMRRMAAKSADLTFELTAAKDQLTLRSHQNGFLQMRQAPPDMLCCLW